MSCPSELASVGQLSSPKLARKLAEGAKNVLTVLSQFNPNVKGKADTVDLTKTYSTEFATKASAG